MQRSGTLYSANFGDGSASLVWLVVSQKVILSIITWDDWPDMTRLFLMLFLGETLDSLDQISWTIHDAFFSRRRLNPPATHWKLWRLKWPRCADNSRIWGCRCLFLSGGTCFSFSGGFCGWCCSQLFGRFGWCWYPKETWKLAGSPAIKR